MPSAIFLLLAASTPPEGLLQSPNAAGTSTTESFPSNGGSASATLAATFRSQQIGAGSGANRSASASAAAAASLVSTNRKEVKARASFHFAGPSKPWTKSRPLSKPKGIFSSIAEVVPALLSGCHALGQVVSPSSTDSTYFITCKVMLLLQMSLNSTHSTIPWSVDGMIAMVAAKPAGGKNFPMRSQHRRGHSLNLASKDSNEGGLDLFSKKHWTLFITSSSSTTAATTAPPPARIDECSFVTNETRMVFKSSDSNGDGKIFKQQLRQHVRLHHQRHVFVQLSHPLELLHRTFKELGRDTSAVINILAQHRAWSEPLSDVLLIIPVRPRHLHLHQPPRSARICNSSLEAEG